MNSNETPGLRTHEDAELFREAVTYTAAETGFLPRLIEKDYFCTLLLWHVVRANNIVFKGGTCLAKVHAEFYRLSEDMDFVVSIPVDAKRALRRKLAEPVRRIIKDLPAPFHASAPMEGHNDSTQYNGAVSYTSLMDGHDEPIHLELSLREPLLMPVKPTGARTLLRDPITGRPMVSPLKLPCIAKDEAFAEKFRAALTRREIAVRDFFDLDHAVQKLKLSPSEPALIELVRQKVLVPGNDPVTVAPERLDQLRDQLDARLRPMLRPQDFATFDLDRAIQIVVEMAKAIAA
ncbi:MAG: nucleotidyl transferase AbiEii/AbiGii toxin family protein [Tepidisphaeraceae bacterium]|jgi:predicted nucleotidyltransferase component of viral defense system